MLIQDLSLFQEVKNMFERKVRLKSCPQSTWHREIQYSRGWWLKESYFQIS